MSSLPVEVLLIFFHHCDYFQLKILSRTCKLFLSILSLPDFDEWIYRPLTTSQLAARKQELSIHKACHESKIHLHPLLTGFILPSAISLRRRLRFIIDVMPVINDSAVWPPAQRIKIKECEKKGTTVIGKVGCVTVGELADAAHNILDARYSKSVEDQCRAFTGFYVHRGEMDKGRLQLMMLWQACDGTTWVAGGPWKCKKCDLQAAEVEGQETLGDT